MEGPRRLIFTHRHWAQRHRCESGPQSNSTWGSGPPHGPQAPPAAPTHPVGLQGQRQARGAGTGPGARLSPLAGAGAQGWVGSSWGELEKAGRGDRHEADRSPGPGRPHFLGRGGAGEANLTGR